jgi:hypothetical protein
MGKRSRRRLMPTSARLFDIVNFVGGEPTRSERDRVLWCQTLRV